MQRSKYLKIDDDISQLKNNFELQNKVLNSEQEKSGKGNFDPLRLPKNQQPREVKMLNSDKVPLRFCTEQEVLEKSQRNLLFKSSFLQKMDHLKQKGKKIEMMNKIERWIDGNIESLYTKASVDYIKSRTKKNLKTASLTLLKRCRSSNDTEDDK